jgi:hypothetical protein
MPGAHKIGGNYFIFLLLDFHEYFIAQIISRL